MNKFLIGVVLLFLMNFVEASQFNPGTKYLQYGGGTSGTTVRIYSGGFQYSEELHNFTYDCAKKGLPLLFVISDAFYFIASVDGDSWVQRMDSSKYFMLPHMKDKYMIYIDHFDDLVKAKHERERNK